MDIHSGKYSALPDISGGSWSTIACGDTVDVVLRVTAKQIPKYPVINSPVADAEFIQSERVFLNVENWRSISVEFLQDEQTIPVKTTDNPFSFSVPEIVTEKGKIKITVQNESGQVSQMHDIIDHPKNNPPVLTKTIAEVFSGEPVGIQLGFYDPDGPEPYVFTILKEPEHGQLSGSGNDRVYRSNSGFTGTDQFTWSVNDGIDDAEKVTVIIHVKKK